MPEPAVSVIMPAYNAERWLEKSIDTALVQTHEDFELIIVDDGSNDRTPEIIRNAAGRDRRIKAVRQNNGGVAKARNRAFQESSGKFIAPLDADDLWHRSKLEKQLAVFKDGGSDLGLVYALYRMIDAEDRVVFSSLRKHISGWTFVRHLGENFIGNGSSPMIRREAFAQSGGYSSLLKARSAEGCEDFLLQLSIAARHKFGHVPEFLVGYRRTDTSMSSNLVQMAISRKIVLDAFAPHVSASVRSVLDDAIYANHANIIRFGLKTGKFVAASRTLAGVAMGTPHRLGQLAGEYAASFRRKIAPPETQVQSHRHRHDELRYFSSFGTTEGLELAFARNSEGEASMHERLDEELGPIAGYISSVPAMGDLLANTPVSAQPGAMTQVPPAAGSHHK